MVEEEDNKINHGEHKHLPSEFFQTPKSRYVDTPLSNLSWPKFQDRFYIWKRATISICTKKQRKNLPTNTPKRRITRATYGFASCPSKGFTSDSMSMLARTKYLQGNAEIN